MRVDRHAGLCKRRGIAVFDRLSQVSEIPQKVARWHLLPNTESLKRLARSLSIGEALSHEEIMTWYLNQIYLGQRCHGVSGAAQIYFGKSVEDLSLGEVAFLAGLPKAPSSFHPVRSYERAVARRNAVLLKMAKAGFIPEEKAKRAIKSDLVVNDTLALCGQDAN